jgi:hypothetical protein
VISLDLALQLRDAGLRWRPATGDRFVLPRRGMDDEVFVLSDMTIEAHEFPTGSVIGFNGVTEWALDSVQQEDALWLPSEEQLRERLGGLFTGLAATARGFAVTVTLPGGTGRVHHAPGAGDAYGAALLEVLREVHRSDVGEHVPAPGG